MTQVQKGAKRLYVALYIAGGIISAIGTGLFFSSSSHITSSIAIMMVIIGLVLILATFMYHSVD